MHHHPPNQETLKNSTNCGYAPPPIKSRNSYQSVNPSGVWVWWDLPCWVKLSHRLNFPKRLENPTGFMRYINKYGVSWAVYMEKYSWMVGYPSWDRWQIITWIWGQRGGSSLPNRIRVRGIYTRPPSSDSNCIINNWIIAEISTSVGIVIVIEKCLIWVPTKKWVLPERVLLRTNLQRSVSY